MMDNKPTCQQLLGALNNACIAAAFGEDAKKQALKTLREMRNKRTTWCGTKELDLRREIDRHLDHYVV